jgi:hypothetical protein
VKEERVRVISLPGEHSAVLDDEDSIPNYSSRTEYMGLTDEISFSRREMMAFSFVG